MNDSEDIFVSRTHPGPVPAGARAERLEQFEHLARISRDQAFTSPPEVLCAAARDTLAIDAATICIFHGTHVSVPVAATGRRADHAEDIQFTLGEGPGLHVGARTRELVPDLNGAQATRTWPFYTAALQRMTPYQAVFAFPLRLSGPPLGVLKLYRRVAGPLTDPDTVAQIAVRITRKLLHETDPDRSGTQWLQESAQLRRGPVWQAQSLVMRANRLGFEDALDLLRGCSIARGTLVPELASEIVAGLVPVPTL